MWSRELFEHKKNIHLNYDDDDDGQLLFNLKQKKILLILDRLTFKFSKKQKKNSQFFTMKKKHQTHTRFQAVAWIQIFFFIIKNFNNFFSSICTTHHCCLSIIIIQRWWWWKKNIFTNGWRNLSHTYTNKNTTSLFKMNELEKKKIHITSCVIDKCVYWMWPKKRYLSPLTVRRWHDIMDCR